MRASTTLVLLALAASPALAHPVFEDARASLPVEHVYEGGWEHFVGGGVAALDCSGNGLPDLFVAGGASPARLFVNESAGPGAPLAFGLGELSGIDEAMLRGVTGVYPLDIDGDGLLDLVVLRVGQNLILRGRGACAFEDVTDAWGFSGGDRWTTAFSATWEPGNLLPTLAIGNYVDRADPNGPFEACDENELHRPVGRRYGAPEPIKPGFCALSMLISDWRRIGQPELRISNDRHYYVRGGYEEMWRLSPRLAPRGDGDGWRRVSLWGMGIASRDITGNGLPDVMLTSMGDQLLQFNTKEGYVDAPFSLGTYAHRPFVGDDGRPSTGWHAEFADIDNDGRADLFIAKGNVDQMPSNAMADPNNLLMQQADGTFVERAVEAGIVSHARARGAALVDLDGDGRLDLVVVNRRAPLELWRNVTPDVGGFVAVTPRQDGPNGFAIGAFVEVRTGGRVQVQELTVGGGHVGGQAGPLHFGIGDAADAEIRVIWPDRTTSAWARVPAGSRVESWRGRERVVLR